MNVTKMSSGRVEDVIVKVGKIAKLKASTTMLIGEYAFLAKKEQLALAKRIHLEEFLWTFDVKRKGGCDISSLDAKAKTHHEEVCMHIIELMTDPEVWISGDDSGWFSGEYDGYYYDVDFRLGKNGAKSEIRYTTHKVGCGCTKNGL
jgi:hypothetical protein